MAVRVMTLEEATGATAPVATYTISDSSWPMRVEHLSVSSIKLFLECPEKWRQRYIVRKKEPVGFWLFRGSVNHRSVDWALKEKMTTGVLPGIGDVLEAFDSVWSDELERQGGEDAILWDDATPDSVKDETARLVGVYHMQVSPTLNPIALEQKFVLETPGIPIPTIGYIDIEEKHRLIDRKEGGRREKTAKPDWVLQAGIYSAVKQKPVEFHVSTKTKVPAVYTAEEDPGLLLPAWRIERAHTYISRVFRSIQTTYLEYGPDEVWLGATTDQNACRYCGYRPSCAWWSE